MFLPHCVEGFFAIRPRFDGTFWGHQFCKCGGAREGGGIWVRSLRASRTRQNVQKRSGRFLFLILLVGKLFYLQLERFLLTVKLLGLQSLKSLIRRTFPL